jgi:heat-inducible transcriptional repressor
MVSDRKPELNDREREILKSVIKFYIADGKPVGSRFISRKRRSDLSPATIRNIMADLEEAAIWPSRIPQPDAFPQIKGTGFTSTICSSLPF